MKYLPKILLVDDEADFLEVSTAVLRNNGFDVYSISNSKEIFTIMKSFKPDIILLDIRLGQDDGRELCKQIKSNPETQTIKVLLHSGFSNTIKDDDTCGADDFILKPYSLWELVAKIKAILQPEGS